MKHVSVPSSSGQRSRLTQSGRSDAARAGFSPLFFGATFATYWAKINAVEVLEFQSPLLRGNVRDRWPTASYFRTLAAQITIVFRKTGTLLPDVMGLRKQSLHRSNYVPSPNGE